MDAPSAFVYLQNKSDCCARQSTSYFGPAEQSSLVRVKGRRVKRMEPRRVFNQVGSKPHKERRLRSSDDAPGNSRESQRAVSQNQGPAKSVGRRRRRRKHHRIQMTARDSSSRQE